MPNFAHIDKRLRALEQSASSEGANVIVVLLSPGAGDVAKSAKIAEAKRSLGLAEDDPRQVMVVIFGADEGATK